MIDFYADCEAGLSHGKLQFKDFCYIVLPKYKYRLVNLLKYDSGMMMTPRTNFEEDIPVEMQYALSRIFEKELEFFE